MNTRKNGVKSKGKGHASRYTHHERQIQHAWELMRQRQKLVEEKNMAEWDRGSKQFMVFVGGMLTVLYGFSVFMAWLCS